MPNGHAYAPTRVAVVHDDPIFLNDTVSALQRAGYDVASFMLQLRLGFPEGTPHGFALALMARNNRPGLKVLFAARPEMAPHTEDIGEVLVAPVTAEGVLAKVKETLADPKRLD